MAGGFPSRRLDFKRGLRGVRLPILGGPNAGLWWSPACGGKVLRVFLGSYERAQAKAMAGSLAAGGIFLDVGAHHGYYTLMAARMVGRGGRVLAFEPDPFNAFYLGEHVRANRLANVEIVEAAVGAKPGMVRFAAGTGTGTGHVAAEGTIEVAMVSLDEALGARGVTPSLVKIDVEGGELDVLRGGERMLAEQRPEIFLSTHGEHIKAACRRHLAEFDYALSPILENGVESATELRCVPSESHSRDRP